MANATLIDFTGKGRADERWHAAHTLIFTKSTRLTLDPGLFAEIQEWPEARKQAELDYMATTIPSSWEFVDVTFLLSGVTRAAAQQITRTRHASYAMQSQRVLNVKDVAVLNTIQDDVAARVYEAAAAEALTAYAALIDRHGVAPQDARGLLPMNATCNLVAKYNLRNFVELVRARESLRVQGEYAALVVQMKRAVLDAWPWAERFFVPPHAHAIALLEEAAKAVGITTGTGPGWQIAKAVDLLRRGK